MSQPTQSTQQPDVNAVIPLDQWFSHERGICGLLNLGNTCFMNTAIQCLMHTPLFVHLFMSNRYREDYEYILSLGNKERTADIRWVQRLNELVRYMWYNGTTLESKRLISPQLFLQDTFEMARRHDLVEFSGFGQKDAIEFLLFVVDRIHQCLSVSTNMYIKGEPGNKLDQHAVSAYTEWIKFFQKEFSPILGIFYGQYYVKVKKYTEDDKCVETTKLYEPFNTISLDIPVQFIQDGRTPTIMDCIRATCGTETIQLNPTEYKKKTTMFWKLPKVLIMTLKRFAYSGKLGKIVEFDPDSSIDMGEFVYGYGKDDSRYRLYAVIHHIGTMESGHYYASIRHRNNRWLCMDDSSIYPIDSSVVKKNVYALLYQHIV